MPVPDFMKTIKPGMICLLVAGLLHGPPESKCEGGTNTGQGESVIARSKQNKEIRMYDIGSGRNVTLFIGGIHGDEPLTVNLLQRFVKDISRTHTSSTSQRIVVVPLLNPDGLARKTRTNANGVDINRNFPTKNWQSTYPSRRYYPGRSPGSEAETRAVIELCEKIKPCKIVVLHTPLRLINYDGPAEALANKMALANSYPLKKYIGYKTPGSVGTYFGKERNIPVITFELSNDGIDTAWKKHKDALRAAVDFVRPDCGDGHGSGN